MLVSASRQDVIVRMLGVRTCPASLARVVTTPCHFGGARHWFECPACARRVAILYQATDGLLCRGCANLVYASQRARAGSRAFGSADRLRKLLGWCPGVLHGWAGKPKGMHWATYRSLIKRYMEAERIALAGMSDGMDRLEQALDATAAKLRLLREP